MFKGLYPQNIFYLLHDLKSKTMIKTLFLDLDDTLFPTQSIDKKLVQPFIDEVARYVPQKQRLVMEKEVWILPFSHIFKKYRLSDQQVDLCLNVLNTVDLQGKIKPYEDYKIVKKLPVQKMLVTTATTDFQWHKIEALGIKQDFTDIVIDDPMKSSAGKEGAFKHLLDKYALNPQSVLVIGDNPNSEIRAGKMLGLTTVLIDRRNRLPEDSSTDYRIINFGELPGILEGLNG